MKKLKRELAVYKETRGIARQAMHQFSIRVYSNMVSNVVNTPAYILRELIWIR